MKATLEGFIMPALSAYFERLDNEFPGTTLELADGRVIRFRSSMRLTDEEIDVVSVIQTELTALSEEKDSDVQRQKDLFIRLLVAVSDAPELAGATLKDLTVGLISLIFKDYTDAVSREAKSEDSAGDTPQA